MLFFTTSWYLAIHLQKMHRPPRLFIKNIFAREGNFLTQTSLPTPQNFAWMIIESAL
jgi:hypothetical protein